LDLEAERSGAIGSGRRVQIAFFFHGKYCVCLKNMALSQPTAPTAVEWVIGLLVIVAVVLLVGRTMGGDAASDAAVPRNTSMPRGLRLAVVARDQAPLYHRVSIKASTDNEAYPLLIETKQGNYTVDTSMRATAQPTSARWNYDGNVLRSLSRRPDLSPLLRDNGARGLGWGGLNSQNAPPSQWEFVRINGMAMLQNKRTGRVLVGTDDILNATLALATVPTGAAAPSSSFGEIQGTNLPSAIRPDVPNSAVSGTGAVAPPSDVIQGTNLLSAIRPNALNLDVSGAAYGGT
jgi:hypothetical protein